MKQLVWDNHACLPLRCEPDFMPELRRYFDAGVDVVSINVTFDMIEPRQGLAIAHYFYDWIAQQQDIYVAKTVDELIKNQGNRLAVVFDIEGAKSVQNDLDLIGHYASLGVRTISAVYNQPNGIGGGCVAEDGGLTNLGREFVRRAEDAGVVVCCSHTGYRTAREIIESSSKPVVFSHSNPLALRNHPRNIPDELIQQVAQTDGVVGINGVGVFLSENNTSTQIIVDHVKYVADLVGVEHVGLGPDYVVDNDELQRWFEGNRDLFPRDVYGDSLDYVEPERIPLIANALLQAGFSASERDLVLGGNWHRVARSVWK